MRMKIDVTDELIERYLGFAESCTGCVIWHALDEVGVAVATVDYSHIMLVDGSHIDMKDTEFESWQREIGKRVQDIDLDFAEKKFDVSALGGWRPKPFSFYIDLPLEMLRMPL